MQKYIQNLPAKKDVDRSEKMYKNVILQSKRRWPSERMWKRSTIEPSNTRGSPMLHHDGEKGAHQNVRAIPLKKWSKNPTELGTLKNAEYTKKVPDRSTSTRFPMKKPNTSNQYPKGKRNYTGQISEVDPTDPKKLAREPEKTPRLSRKHKKDTRYTINCRYSS